MLPRRIYGLLSILMAFAFGAPLVPAVVVEGRWYHGQHVQCIHGGAWFSETQLGVYSRARLYEQVFTGTVQSAVEASFTDKRLEIIPDEVFLGDVSARVTATVNQACLPTNLPEIKAGDKWLFFARTKKYLHPDAKPPYITTDGLEVVFDSPAKPVLMAEYDVCLLRLHSDLDESCIASMPSRTDGPVVCEIQPQPLISPFPRPVQSQLPTPTLTLNLAHLGAPPEFRRNDSKTADANGGLLQNPRRPPPCPNVPPQDVRAAHR